jgi:hypothetical protein
MRIGRLFVSILVGGMLVSVPVTALTATKDDGSKYSDRDRMRSAKGDEEKLEQALKTGEEKAFYRRELAHHLGKL